MASTTSPTGPVIAAHINRAPLAIFGISGPSPAIAAPTDPRAPTVFPAGPIMADMRSLSSPNRSASVRLAA